MTTRRALLVSAIALVLGLVAGMTAMYAVTTRASLYAAQAAIVAASTALERGDIESATGHAYAAIANDPSAYLGYAVLGDVLVRRGNAKAANDAFSKALDILGPNPSTDQTKADKRIIEAKRAAIDATQ